MALSVKNGVRAVICGAVALCANFAFVIAAEAACLRNDAHRTVYVSLAAPSEDVADKIGNLVIGDQFCIPVKKGVKVVIKVTPYGGARFGCKIFASGNENLVLTKFGNMNNCTFVPDNK